MPSYKIFLKTAPDKQVYEYTADNMVDWDLFPFSTHTHTLFVPEEIAMPRIYGGRRILTKFEFRKLFPSEIKAIDKFAATFEAMPLPDVIKDDIRTGLLDYEMSGNVNLDEPATIKGVNMYVQLGLLTPKRMIEVLNG